MNILLDPNIAYLILVGGFLLAILAVFAPGSGFLEVGALFAVGLAAYAAYNLPINPWALALLVLGVFPFVIAVRRSHRLIYLGFSLAAMAVGSAFLFRTPTGAPAVNLVLAVVVTLVTLPLLWVVTRKTLVALEMRPSQDLGRLIGEIGEARTALMPEGTVYVGGEAWSARSRLPVQRNAQVRVLSRTGLVLDVEPVETTEPKPAL
ncbi:MAG TPA: NfeD family protein [Anaerolineaceae bacterium]|jgi:membrane-bound serine protease (ClpP class)